MIEKIVVYVRNESIPVRTRISVRGPIDHPCLDRETTKTEKVLSENDRLVLDVVNEFAAEKSLQVEVCDVSTAKGRLKGSVRGISKTPVVMIGQEKIECDHGSEVLKNRLRAFLSE